MPNNIYSIQTATREELDFAIQGAIKEGWNPGFYDADPFYACDPDGYLIGKLNGEPIACVSGVAYGDSFGFLGFYIVKPEYRKKGYGMQLYKAVMKHLEGRKIGLDGVIEQHKNYMKEGFRLAYHNIRNEGVVQGKPCDEIVPVQDIPFEKVLQYDRQCFPAEREVFLRAWLGMPNISTAAKTNGDVLKGYGVIRSCHVGFKIGPLFADDPETAEQLFLTLALYAGGAPLYLDTPEVNPAAVALAEKYNMKRVFETVRMYNEESPDIALNKVFGVTTFELG